MPTALITSRDPKGMQAVSIFEAAYNKAKLDDTRAQRLNERGNELKAGISRLIAELSVSDQYANEEVSSSWTYPERYAVNDITVQIEVLTRAFPQLDTKLATEFVGDVLTSLELPEGAEGWFAIPRWEKLAPSYGEALAIVLAAIKKSRKFVNYREGQLGPQYLRQHERTALMLAEIAADQPGDILVIPSQFGLRHRGRSIRRAREVLTVNEFGHGALAVGSMTLTHPERFVRWEQLHADCPGDEFSSEADGEWTRAPIFYFGGELVGFRADWYVSPDELYGSVSGFVPQF